MWRPNRILKETDICNMENTSQLFKEYPDVVSVAELQSMLRIGRNLAYKLLKNGVIESIKIGKRYIIPKSNVICFLIHNNKGKLLDLQQLYDIISPLDVVDRCQGKEMR